MPGYYAARHICPSASGLCGERASSPGPECGRVVAVCPSASGPVDPDLFILSIYTMPNDQYDL